MGRLVVVLDDPVEDRLPDGIFEIAYDPAGLRSVTAKSTVYREFSAGMLSM